MGSKYEAGKPEEGKFESKMGASGLGCEVLHNYRSVQSIADFLELADVCSLSACNRSLDTFFRTEWRRSRVSIDFDQRQKIRQQLLGNNPNQSNHSTFFPHLTRLGLPRGNDGYVGVGENSNIPSLYLMKDLLSHKRFRIAKFLHQRSPKHFKLHHPYFYRQLPISLCQGWPLPPAIVSAETVPLPHDLSLLDLITLLIRHRETLETFDVATYDSSPLPWKSMTSRACPQDILAYCFYDTSAPMPSAVPSPTPSTVPSLAPSPNPSPSGTLWRDTSRSRGADSVRLQPTALQRDVLLRTDQRSCSKSSPGLTSGLASDSNSGLSSESNFGSNSGSNSGPGPSATMPVSEPARSPLSGRQGRGESAAEYQRVWCPDCAPQAVEHAACWQAAGADVRRRLLGSTGGKAREAEKGGKWQNWHERWLGGAQFDFPRLKTLKYHGWSVGNFLALLRALNCRRFAALEHLALGGTLVVAPSLTETKDALPRPTLRDLNGTLPALEKEMFGAGEFDERFMQLLSFQYSPFARRYPNKPLENFWMGLFNGSFWNGESFCQLKTVSLRFGNFDDCSRWLTPLFENCLARCPKLHTIELDHSILHPFRSDDPIINLFSMVVEARQRCKDQAECQNQFQSQSQSQSSRLPLELFPSLKVVKLRLMSSPFEVARLQNTLSQIFQRPIFVKVRKLHLRLFTPNASLEAQLVKDWHHYQKLRDKSAPPLSRPSSRPSSRSVSPVDSKGSKLRGAAQPTPGNAADRRVAGLVEDLNAYGIFNQQACTVCVRSRLGIGVDSQNIGRGQAGDVCVCETMCVCECECECERSAQLIISFDRPNSNDLARARTRLRSSSRSPRSPASPRWPSDAEGSLFYGPWVSKISLKHLTPSSADHQEFLRALRFSPMNEDECFAPFAPVPLFLQYLVPSHGSSLSRSHQSLNHTYGMALAHTHLVPSGNGVTHTRTHGPLARNPSLLPSTTAADLDPDNDDTDDNGSDDAGVDVDVDPDADVDGLGDRGNKQAMLRFPPKFVDSNFGFGSKSGSDPSRLKRLTVQLDLPQVWQVSEETAKELVSFEVEQLRSLILSHPDLQRVREARLSSCTRLTYGGSNWSFWESLVSRRVYRRGPSTETPQETRGGADGATPRPCGLDCLPGADLSHL